MKKLLKLFCALILVCCISGTFAGCVKPPENSLGDGENGGGENGGNIENSDGLEEQYMNLSELYPWIRSLREGDISEVRYEQGFNGVAPGNLKNIAYSTNRTDIEKTYRLLSSTLLTIPPEEGQRTGGWYVQYDFFIANGETCSLRVSNQTLLIGGQYYRFIDKLYAFEHAYLNCNAFVTYQDRYEIYTYAETSVKVGDYEDLGQLEFIKCDGLMASMPSYYLRSDAINLLILSEDRFMIEGDDNTVIYQTTGKKNFAQFFKNEL